MADQDEARPYEPGESLDNEASAAGSMAAGEKPKASDSQPQGRGSAQGSAGKGNSTQRKERRKKPGDPEKEAGVTLKWWARLLNLLRGLVGIAPLAAKAKEIKAEGKTPASSTSVAGASSNDNDPSDDPDANQPGNDVSWAQANSAVVGQVVDDISDRYQDVMLEQAKGIFQHRDAVFSEIGGLTGGVVGAEALQRLAGHAGIGGLRDTVHERLDGMKEGLASLQGVNNQRQLELTSLENKLTDPQALESLDHAASKMDERAGRDIQHAELAIKETEDLVSQLDRAMAHSGQMAQSPEPEQYPTLKGPSSPASKAPDLSSHPGPATVEPDRDAPARETTIPVDPDHPDHPLYPVRQAAREEMALASMDTPQGPGEGAGSIEQAVKALEDLDDIPLPGDALGR